MPEVLEQIRSTASLLVPEIILLATACVLFFFGPFLVSDAGESSPGLRGRWGLLSLVGVGAAWIFWFVEETAPSGGTLFHIDSLTWYVRGLSFTGGLLLILEIGRASCRERV